MLRVLALALCLFCALASGAQIGVNDSGTWRTITKVAVNDSGTWRTIQRIAVNDSGTWRVVFQYFAPTNPFTAYDLWADNAAGNSASASITLASDGSIGYNLTSDDAGSTIGSANWASPTLTGGGANYWTIFSATTGTFTSNDASTCVNLGTARTATKSGTTGSASVTFTITIYSDSGCTSAVATWTGNVLRYQHTL